MATPHFSDKSLKFLRALKRNNDREWFEPRKPVYEAELKAPMLAIIDAITSGCWGCQPAIGQDGKCVYAEIPLRDAPIGRLLA